MSLKKNRIMLSTSGGAGYPDTAGQVMQESCKTLSIYYDFSLAGIKTDNATNAKKEKTR